MKLMWLLLLLVSCASHHNASFAPSQPFTPATGATYQSFIKNWTEKNACVEIGDDSYCKWDDKAQVYLFRKEKFVSSIEVPEDSLKYRVNINSLATDEKFSGKVVLAPSSKRLHEKSIEWRKYSPTILKVVKAAGLEVTERAKTDFVIKLSFGITNAQDELHRRYVNFSAEKDGDEIWRISVSSDGASRDFDRILPVLLTASFDLIREPSNINRTLILSEQDLSVVALKNHLRL